MTSPLHPEIAKSARVSSNFATVSNQSSVVTSAIDALLPSEMSKLRVISGTTLLAEIRRLLHPADIDRTSIVVSFPLPRPSLIRVKDSLLPRDPSKSVTASSNPLVMEPDATLFHAERLTSSVMSLTTTQVSKIGELLPSEINKTPLPVEISYAPYFSEMKNTKTLPVSLPSDPGNALEPLPSDPHKSTAVSGEPHSSEISKSTAVASNPQPSEISKSTAVSENPQPSDISESTAVASNLQHSEIIESTAVSENPHSSEINDTRCAAHLHPSNIREMTEMCKPPPSEPS